VAALQPIKLSHDLQSEEALNLSDLQLQSNVLTQVSCILASPDMVLQHLAAHGLPSHIKAFTPVEGGLAPLRPACGCRRSRRRSSVVSAALLDQLVKPFTSSGKVSITAALVQVPQPGTYAAGWSGVF